MMDSLLAAAAECDCDVLDMERLPKADFLHGTALQTCTSTLQVVAVLWQAGMRLPCSLEQSPSLAGCPI